MPTPFQQRASEYRGNEAEFLATLSPSLFRMTLDPHSDPREMLHTTVVFTSPPGTGKTTLARFFQYATLKRLMEQVQRTQDGVFEELKSLAQERGFIQDEQLVVCGARISFERDYRELALIGYSEQRALELMLSLVGARAILAWRQMFQGVGISADRVELVPTTSGGARLDYLGGARLDQVAERAAQVESIIYRLTASFIPPKEEDLLAQLGGQFYPFLAIDGFHVPELGTLKPLIMIDDAHWADRAQHEALMAHLTLREVSMARWVLQRMEALDPKDTLIWGHEDAIPATDNLQRLRQVVDIRMTQAPDDKRGAVRKAFRRAANEIATRAMQHIPELRKNGITTLAGLEIKAEATAKQKEEIQKLPENVAFKLKIGAGQVDQIRQRVYTYVGRNESEFDAATIAPAMVSILLHRQFNRARQHSLFDGNADESLAEEVLVDADADVAAGAQVRLWHDFKVPYLGGLDVVADLGTENAETFLQLAWELVQLLETQEIIRGDRSTSLTVKQQHEVLAKVGERIVGEWSFPHAISVRRLVEGISTLCLARSLEPNAPLGGGANSVGIEQSEFAEVMKHPKLVEALRFGLGYNAFSLIPSRNAKSKKWTVLELSGPVIAYKGLTTRRGGFVPIKLATLVAMIDGGPR
ncbi:MAG: hypothetical protein JSR63_12750 [Proteobacteria bacterium]|nr:hypothetical protein [Pseudomonadota bacterium]